VKNSPQIGEGFSPPLENRVAIRLHACRTFATPARPLTKKENEKRQRHENLGTNASERGKTRE
jgi:hypothetical protein